MNDREESKECILGCILEGRVPERSDLEEVYDKEFAAPLQDHIKRLLDQRPSDGKVRRPHLNEEIRDVREAKRRVEHDPAFQRLHGTILAGNIPSIDELEPWYGVFTPWVRHAFEAYRHCAKVRRCFTPLASHPNRVAAVVKFLSMDDQQPPTYTALAAMHDVIEDLLTYAHDESDREYGIGRYTEFMDDFIPPELHGMLPQLTNHSALLISLVNKRLNREGYQFTRSHATAELRNMLAHADRRMHSPITKLCDFIADAPSEAIDLPELGWECYQRFYIAELAVESHGAMNYRPFEIKAVDLADNAIDRDALELDGRIRSLIKIQTWVDHGWSQNPTWQPTVRKLRELQEDALTHAEDIIRERLFHTSSTMDYITSAFKCIDRLSHVLYV
ncbi:MAG: hypothetical protein QHI48_04785 [Bacteroidota bacterium]|nr:hypothetical protein [Bacteroidota bacterium]